MQSTIENRQSSIAMNRWERLYAEYLDLRVAAQEIASWRFGLVKLRLANKTWYTPDFMVTPLLNVNELLERRREAERNGEVEDFLPAVYLCRLEFHEVKGFMRDDAAVKIKVAAAMYAQFRFVLVRRVKATRLQSAGWDFKVVGESKGRTP